MALKLRSKSKKNSKQDAANNEENEEKKNTPKQKKTFFRKSSKKKAEDAKNKDPLNVEDAPLKVEDKSHKVEDDLLKPENKTNDVKEVKEEKPEEGEQTDEESEASIESVAPNASADDSDISGWLEEKKAPEQSAPYDEDKHADEKKKIDKTFIVEAAKNEVIKDTPNEQVEQKSRGALSEEEEVLDDQTAKAAYTCCGVVF